MLNENNPFFLYSADLPMQTALKIYTPLATGTPTNPLCTLSKGNLKCAKKEPSAANSRTEHAPTPPFNPPGNGEPDKIPHKETDKI